MASQKLKKKKVSARRAFVGCWAAVWFALLVRPIDKCFVRPGSFLAAMLLALKKP